MKLLKFIKEWDELWSLPIALVLFMISPTVFRWYDPTAGSYDIGLLQKAFLAFIFLLIGNAFAYLLVRMNNKKQYQKLDTECNESLSPWEQTKLAYLRYYFYLGSFILLIALMK